MTALGLKSDFFFLMLTLESNKLEIEVLTEAMEELREAI